MRVRSVLLRHRWLLAAALVMIAAPHVLLAALDRLHPLPDGVLDRLDASPIVTTRDGRPMHVGLRRDEGRLVPTAREALSPHLLHAAVAAEDRRFGSHRGVDGFAIVRAACANAGSDGSRQGASTITMQLARLLFGTPRTFAGKAVQAFRALQLERRYAKEEILVAYLNRVPFGGNLLGAGAASRAFFGKAARDLTAGEAALLVSLLPAPARFAPRRDPEGARVRRDRVLDRMHAEGFLDDHAWRAARAAPLVLRPTAFPDVAPHAWQRVGEGRSSIDPDAQRALESIARGADGVDGLAIVLVRQRDRGRPRAGRGEGGGRAPPRRDRSSAQRRLHLQALPLRPRLRPRVRDARDPAPRPALARAGLDARQLRSGVARTRPRRRGAGAVAQPARGAVGGRPAVRRVRRRRCGARAAPTCAHPARVRPSISRSAPTTSRRWSWRARTPRSRGGGRWRAPWIAERDAAPGGSVRVCSPGASSFVTQILADPARPRPDGAAPCGIAWKTGTSSRRRDAWAAGFTRRYTAVVWRGRLDGRPDDSLVGARAATPLLFAALQAVDPAPAPFEDEGVVDVAVCAETGLACTDACRAPQHRPASA